MPSSEEIGSDRYGSGIQKPRRNKFKGRRAARACETCRRLKTRCIISPVPNEFYCLRCESLGIRCSFQDIMKADGVEKSDIYRHHDSQKSQDDNMDANSIKMLIKHGYGEQDVHLTSKLLHSINNNVIKVLNVLKQRDFEELSCQNVLAKNNPKPLKVSPVNEEGLPSLEAVKMLTSVSAPTPRISADIDKQSQDQSSSFLSSSLYVTEQRHTLPYMTSPFTLLSQLVSKDNLPIPVRKLYDHGFQNYHSEIMEDIITMNLVTFQEALCLIGDFRHRYGAWCSLPPTIETKELLDDMRSKGCSLLIATMCVLALRYTKTQYDLKTRVYKSLLLKLKADLEYSLKFLPQSTEFLQAIVILSLYASSFSSDILSIDAWYLSGIGIQQYLTANIHDALLAGTCMGSNSDVETPFFFGLQNVCHSSHNSIYKDNSTIVGERDEGRSFMSLRLWNHLCLVHITHSIYSGRMCVIDEIRLDLSRRILELPNATNFDGRMVGEIALHLILYNFMQKCNTINGSHSYSIEDLESVQEDLSEWLEEWNYLFTQPITQFLEFAYHYGYTMILYTWYHRVYRLGKATNEFTSYSIQKNDTRREEREGASEKIDIANFLNKNFPIEAVVRSIPMDLRVDFLTHSHKALHNLVKTDFDTFQYLSDQLIFAGVLCSLLCIVVLHDLKSMNKTTYASNEILADIKSLSLRLQRIRTDELKSFWVEEVDLKIPSVILQYHKAIESLLQEKFPHYEPKSREL